MAEPSPLERAEAALKFALEQKLYRRISFFEPYDKQRLFMAEGATKRERALFAGNQLGKTYCGAAEATYHLTGEYPEWWEGRRFDKPVHCWLVGETSAIVRDVQQKLLCGEPGVEDSLGTGFIPKDRFADKPSLARGVTDAFDTVQVTHRTNGVVDGISTAKFKSYEQGRQKFQSATLDFIWCDEEAPADIYSEILTRVTATGGMVYCTFTPLKGMSDVVQRYLGEPSPDRWSITMVIDDAKHISQEEKVKIIAGYPAHEREARARGVPMMGSGRIFQFSEDSISEPQLQHIPLHWRKLWGIDFGVAHPFAAVLILHDPDNDVIHIHHALRVSDQGPLQHAAAMKPIGAAVPVAWPQDGTQRREDGGNLISMAAQYRKHGLLMIGTHATWPDGGNSTETGLTEMNERFATGRLKVANHLSQWFEEFGLYHRKDGVIVKLRDDLMSATRIALMMRRYGRPVPLGGSNMAKRRESQTVADGLDFDPFGT